MEIDGVYCSHSECGKEINVRERKYVTDEKERHYFCDCGCKAMWAVENSQEVIISELRNKGVEHLVSRHQMIDLKEKF